MFPMLLAATSDATKNLYVLTAFGGGIISFLSPCVLPIVPGYLSLVTGLSIGEIQSDDKQTTRDGAHHARHRACSCSGSRSSSCCSGS